MSIIRKWNGKARSNYFKVKDKDAFYEWAYGYNLEVWEDTRDGEKYFAIFPEYDYTEGLSWPYMSSDIENDDPHWDFAIELSAHLKDGSVAVLMQCGGDGLRYFTGDAIAVNSKGEKVEVSLGDIYEKAMELGSEITFADDDECFCK